MFPKAASRLLVSAKSGVFSTRNLGSTAILMNKTDPIQQLFLDKIKEYYQKKA